MIQVSVIFQPGISSMLHSYPVCLRTLTAFDLLFMALYVCISHQLLVFFFPPCRGGNASIIVPSADGTKRHWIQ
jgi:hypothetical protein